MEIFRSDFGFPILDLRLTVSVFAVDKRNPNFTAQGRRIYAEKNRKIGNRKSEMSLLYPQINFLLRDLSFTVIY
ncbi:MAG: hypothetical protein FD123_2705 [Bacteroidetes bacterium]|nr:MAG: hypothetical protein FD123_2705 [Bacteroidota bacterium]